MLQLDDPQTAWLMLIARAALASVFLVSGIHKGLWYSKAAAEFERDNIPLIPVTLSGTIVLHLLGSICIILGWYAQEAALALGIFTVAATLKVHAYWKLPKPEQLARSRITINNLSVTGGLLLLVAVGPGSLALSP